MQPPSQVLVEQASICILNPPAQAPVTAKKKIRGKRNTLWSLQTEQLSLDQGRESLKKRVTMRSGVPTTGGHSGTEGDGVIGYRLPALLQAQQHVRSFATKQAGQGFKEGTLIIMKIQQKIVPSDIRVSVSEAPLTCC